MSTISIKNVTKNFGKFTAISDINLEVEKGEFFGFIGPNGAGKSTTIKVLLNFIFPSTGSASILGLDCSKQSAEIKTKTSYVPSEVKYYNNVRVSRILKYAESFHPNSDKERTQMLCDRFEVDLGKKMKELSLGNKKKVAVVQALLHNPEVIILDEPTSGLDPLMQTRLLETLVEENKKGTTVFLSSHNLNEVQHVCKRVAIIKKGKIIDIQDLSNVHNLPYKAVVTSTNNLGSLESIEGVKSLEQNGDIWTLEFDGNVDHLVKAISKFEITEIEMGRMKIEDTFINYYK